MGKKIHFINVTVIILVATFLLRLVFGWMFQLPYGPAGQETMGTFGTFMGLNIPAPASAESVAIDIMFNSHFWMISFLFALIMGLMLYSVVVFRRQEGDDSDAPHIHSNNALEIAWTVIPVIIVLGFGGYGWIELNKLVEPKDNEMTVQVQGFQWGWNFSYPEEGPRARAGQLVLPVGQPILLEMNATDVLHAFWVPEFRVKQDLVPGRTTYLRFTPTDVGEYRLRCAEICGQGHAGMYATVRVVDRAEYDMYIEDLLNREPWSEMTPEERGRRIWDEGLGGTGAPNCGSCHSIDGSLINGPSWLGLWMKEGVFDDGTTYVGDAEYIRNAILNPNENIVEGFQPNVMYQEYDVAIPAFEAEVEAIEGDFGFDAIADIIAFIQTLEEEAVEE